MQSNANDKFNEGKKKQGAAEMEKTVILRKLNQLA